MITKKITEKFADDNQTMLRMMELLTKIHKNKKCFMCRYKFPDGILNKHPEKVVPFAKMVRGDFLFHLKATHGIEPVEFFDMLEKTINKSR